MQQSTNGPRVDNEPWPLLTAKSILTQIGARADQPCRTVYMKMGFFENCLKKRKMLFWSCIYTKTAFSLKSRIFRKFENTALFGFVYGFFNQVILIENNFEWQMSNCSRDNGEPLWRPEWDL